MAKNLAHISIGGKKQRGFSHIQLNRIPLHSGNFIERTIGNVITMQNSLLIRAESYRFTSTPLDGGVEVNR